MVDHLQVVLWVLHNTNCLEVQGISLVLGRDVGLRTSHMSLWESLLLLGEIE